MLSTELPRVEKAIVSFLKDRREIEGDYYNYLTVQTLLESPSVKAFNLDSIPMAKLTKLASMAKKNLRSSRELEFSLSGRRAKYLYLGSFCENGNRSGKVIRRNGPKSEYEMDYPVPERRPYTYGRLQMTVPPELLRNIIYHQEGF